MGITPFHKWKWGIIASLALFLLFPPVLPAQQKVGLVLSGGGAGGIAHVGVLKALEENNIPIDYITGTSMGALIGGLYAAGYSPDQIIMMVTSDKFQEMAQGNINEKYAYYYKKREEDASWVTIKLSQDTIWQTSLPTNVISPITLDFEMMANLTAASAVSNYNFDSLFVPFRCVAADIEAKEQVIFSKGYLSQAIRASMSYPFYLLPITVDGKILFDGGLYNNFPSDIMYDDFFPDIIIGSNVSGNVSPPTEDDVLSQIKNMLVAKTNYSVICDNGCIIQPEVDVAVFDFSNVQSIIDSGYHAASREMEKIKAGINRRVSDEELEEKRMSFWKRKPEIIFGDINVEGLNKSQSGYVKKTLGQGKQGPVSIGRLESGYYRVFGDDKIRGIYPTAKFNKNTGLYDLTLKVKKEKEIILDFGGNIASSPINQAYIGARYNYLGKFGLSVMSNLYFGRLYGSAQVKTRFDFPVSLPFYIEPEFTRNRWDYFKSRTAFFDEVKPSFLVQNELYGGINIGFPVNDKGKVRTGFSIAQLVDDYYQTRNFTQVDTPDVTFFRANSIYLQYIRSTLNRKQYANQGSYFSLEGRIVEGEEKTEPGSTSRMERDFAKLHEWGQIKLTYDNYYKSRGALRLGFYAEAVYSSQRFFNNYTASILRAPVFQPTPESKTRFLESFRAYQYAAVGHKIIVHIRKNFDLRLEGYIFQPYREIRQDADLTVSYGGEWAKRFTIAMANLVYHTPIGPISISTNYYHNLPEIAQETKTPLTFLFHFGYVIFNDRALR